MKRLLTICVLVGVLLSFSPVVHAQTDLEYRQQLITLIINLISELQAKLDAILASQTVSGSAITQSTTPTVITPTTPTALQVSCTKSIEGDLETFTINASGGDGNYGYMWNDCSSVPNIGLSLSPNGTFSPVSDKCFIGEKSRQYSFGGDGTFNVFVKSNGEYKWARCQ